MRFRIIIALCLVFFALAAGLCWFVQTPRFWKYALTQALQKDPNVHVSKLSVESARLTGNFLALKGIHARIRINKHSLSVSNVNVELHMAWKPFKLGNVSGRVQASEAVFDKYTLTHVQVPLSWHDAHWSSGSWSADFAEGALKGEMSIVPSKDKAYYRVNVSAVRIHTQSLAVANPGVFGQITAELNGRASFEGEGQKITTAHGQFSAVPGGVMKAKILSYIAQYVPQHKALAELISQNADVPLDQGDIGFDAASGQQWRTHVKVLSKAVNLDINVDMDINVSQP